MFYITYFIKTLKRKSFKKLFDGRWRLGVLVFSKFSLIKVRKEIVQLVNKNKGRQTFWEVKFVTADFTQTCVLLWFYFDFFYLVAIISSLFILSCYFKCERVQSCGFPYVAENKERWRLCTIPNVWFFVVICSVFRSKKNILV